MKKEDAEKVIQIILECDGGCEHCASNLLKLFCKEFPEYIQLSKKVFLERFGKEFNYFESD